MSSPEFSHFDWYKQFAKDNLSDQLRELPPDSEEFRYGSGLLMALEICKTQEDLVSLKQWVIDDMIRDAGPAGQKLGKITPGDEKKLNQLWKLIAD